MEAGVSATPDISVQAHLPEAPAQNLCDYSDLLSHEPLVPSVSLALNSNPKLNTEQQQILADDIALVSDDAALWPESFGEQERLDLIKKGLTQIKKNLILLLIKLVTISIAVAI